MKKVKKGKKTTSPMVKDLWAWVQGGLMEK
jgi:hypothetical protein